MASSCGTDADKGSLRSHYLAFRKRLSSSVRDAADEGVARRVMGMPEVAAAPVVLSYVSFGSEVQTLGVIRSLLSSGRRVAVPRCDEAAHSMAFYEIGALSELAPGARRRWWGPRAWFPASRLTPAADALAMAAGTTTVSWPSIPVTRSVSAAVSS